MSSTRIKNIVIRTISAMIIVLILMTPAGCGKNDTTGVPNTDETTGEKAGNDIGDDNIEPVHDENAFVICIDAMEYNDLAAALKAFEAENPDLKVEYDVLPHLINGGSGEDRESALNRIRTALMAGKGADMYIMGSDYLIGYDYGKEYGDFLSDVTISAGNGVFCDMLPVFEDAGISVENYNPAVMAAGKIGGKQYVVPLSYCVPCIITNDASKAVMGEEAFKSADAMMDGLLAMTEIPGACSFTGTGFTEITKEAQNIATYFNPFYLSSPSLINYAEHKAEIDTPLTRKILTVCKTAEETMGDIDANASASPPTADRWAEYAGSNRYLVMGANLDTLVLNMGIAENHGITAHLDPIPTETGGISAIITRYAAVSASSEHKSEAAQLIEMILSETYMQKSVWPVRMGTFESNLESFISPGRSIMGYYFKGETYTQPLSEETVKAFLGIEAGITEARFALPGEVKLMLEQYYEGETDLETAVNDLQHYYEMSLWAAD